MTKLTTIVTILLLFGVSICHARGHGYSGYSRKSGTSAYSNYSSPHSYSGGGGSQSGGYHHSSKMFGGGTMVHLKDYTRNSWTPAKGYGSNLPQTKAPKLNSKDTGTWTPGPRWQAPSPKPKSSDGSTHFGGVKRDMNGHIMRSQKAKDDFKKLNPCPGNGNTSGACPGYVIDHINPLKRGGPDTPDNMQWQTVEDAKEKDRIE